ncbi:MAG: hypothetical protein NT069_36030, partial [Planctomycetota bacterium]|nr:hypothetical protein [Planctomycetota bacterium]
MNETLKFGHQKLNITGVASRRDAEYDPDGRQQSRDTELHREDRRMDLQRAIPLICGTLFVSLLLNSLLAVDDSISEKADQNEQSIAKVLSSDKAVVKNIVYG